MCPLLVNYGQLQLRLVAAFFLASTVQLLAPGCIYGVVVCLGAPINLSPAAQGLAGPCLKVTLAIKNRKHKRW